MAFMNTVVTLDSAGRVVIPTILRDALQLAPGDTLALESDGDRLTLRPVRPGSGLQKEHGIWVFRTGQKLSAEGANRALESLRQERERRARGTPA